MEDVLGYFLIAGLIPYSKERFLCISLTCSGVIARTPTELLSLLVYCLLSLVSGERLTIDTV